MTDRASELAEAVAAAGGNGAGAYLTAFGEVRVGSIVVDGDTAEVHLMGAVEGGDPAFRIVNPPLLVPDLNGDVMTAHGPHRRDPIAALVHVIGSLGGAVKQKGRRVR